MPRFGSTFARRLVLLVVLAAIMTLLTAGTTLGALVGGALPTAGFTYLSVTDNEVNMTGDGVHLKSKGTVNVKTTYSRVAPSAALLGWHYHNGPVIVTVTTGVLTFFDGNCGTWDVDAGHTYIESTGEVLNARLDPLKNPGVAAVEWFTTRLFPEGTTDPVEVDAPCAP
jgi:quercetin dioxygenase-like cupin family protein